METPAQTTTFVSTFMTIYDRPFQNKDVNWRFNHFKRLCETGISLAVFCSRDVVPQFEEEILAKYSNVVLLEALDLSETWVYQTYNKVVNEGIEINMPNTRHPEKDTKEYLLLMNSKTELMIRAILKNPFQSTHYAWVDFNIFYIFREDINRQRATHMLQQISHQTPTTQFLMFPGCWGKDMVVENHLMNDVCWRFCGGFFIGSQERIIAFHMEYETHFENFLRTHKKLVWEVNFWAYLELNHGLSITWYSGDHNETILNVNIEHLVDKLCEKPACSHHRYEYPDHGEYIPTSTSYVCHKGDHIINTRYVNYWLWPNAAYMIRDPDSFIRTRNFSSKIEWDNERGAMTPLGFGEMVPVGLTCHGGSIYGLEDIRLYTTNTGELGFIATTINYSGIGRNRMVKGIYDVEGGILRDCSVLIPPDSNSWCEKNWIPIVRGFHEYYIYRWHPFEIGVLQEVENGKQLVITRTYENTSMFSNIRGSTPFVETGEGLLGVVHFSYEGYPRRYFHMLVLLDKEEMIPIKTSNVFVFNNLSIEFCIGFMVEGETYLFWISNFDRDPEVISIGSDKFVW